MIYREIHREIFSSNGYIVLDSVNMALRDEDNILDLIYRSKSSNYLCMHAFLFIQIQRSLRLLIQNILFKFKTVLKLYLKKNKKKTVLP